MAILDILLLSSIYQFISVLFGILFDVTCFTPIWLGREIMILCQLKDLRLKNVLLFSLLFLVAVLL